MMKKILFTLAFSAILFSCKTDNKKVENANKETEIEVKVAEVPVLALGEFEAKAGDFINKEIQIQGIVDHVCKHSGKKLLVVNDEGDVHITSDVRFDDTLKGNEILVTGIVLEEKIDEAYCLKMEEDNIKSHTEGASNKEQFESKQKLIQKYRDQMKEENIEYIPNYSLKYVSHKNVSAE